jgi:hypothetical protein
LDVRQKPEVAVAAIQIYRPQRPRAFWAVLFAEVLIVFGSSGFLTAVVTAVFGVRQIVEFVNQFSGNVRVFLFRDS